ncbi:hypothetical protein TNCV_1484511 [Trichonephila clavipes]|nr:hypothetical protein TNCV_1484511 [Trichonephila clavipes]
MYGSTCAKICSRRNEVSELYKACCRCRIIWEVGEGRSVTSVAAVRNCSRHRFTTLETISNYGNSYPGSSVRSSTVPHLQMTHFDVLQARRSRRQTAGGNRAHDTGDWTTDIAFYRGPRLHGGFVCMTPCTVNVLLTPIGEGVLWRVPEHRERRDNEWGREYSLQMRADSV